MNKKNKNYIAMLYKKYDLGGRFYLFRPYRVLKNCSVDFDRGVLTDSRGHKFNSIESRKIERPYTFYYDGPAEIEDSKKVDERCKEYFKNFSGMLIYAAYIKDEDYVKTVYTCREHIMEAEIDSWWYSYQNFGMNDDFEEEIEERLESLNSGKGVFIPKDVLSKILDSYRKYQYDKINCFFEKVYRELFGENSFTKVLEVDDDYLEEEKELSYEEAMENVKTYLDELDSLIGLDDIKKEVRTLVDYLLYLEKVKDNISLEKPNLNMFFSGSPGTGKTTVARIIAKILHALGYAKSSKFEEVTTKDLIGGYVGQTAIKTDKVISKNKGGVIFIDEAYSFSEEGQMYGQEALVEIIKEMESKETIFIFAGYKDEMKKFIEMNPGLSSRVGYYIDYKDYSIDELYQIFESKVNKSKLKLADDVHDKVIEVIEEASSKQSFGNGRFIDKMFYNIVRKHAVNSKYENDKEKLITICGDDIDSELSDNMQFNSNTKNPIGFSGYQKVKKR